MDEFATPSNITWSGNTGVVEYGGGDKSMICIFYNRPTPVPGKSTAAGRPVFEDQIFARIHPPGERLNIVDRKMIESDKRRWPMQWAMFEKNQQQFPDGTPIDLLYPETPAIGATLRASSVFTIEQCAALSASAIENVGMGCQAWVNSAVKYLEAAAKGVNASQMRHELEERDREIRVLKRTVDELKNTLEDMRANGLQQPNLAQLQTIIAGAMARPTHMPQQGFDPQSAMINATSATAQVTQAARGRRVRPKVA